MRICYISNVDISLPNGPGVNEREFLWTLQRRTKEKGDLAYVVIPKPSKKLDFSLDNARYLGEDRGEKRRWRYLFHKLLMNWKSINIVKRLAARADVDLFVIRIELGNILVPFLLLLFRRPYAVKTFEKFFDLEDEGGRVLRRVFASCLRPDLEQCRRDRCMHAPVGKELQAHGRPSKCHTG
jgi:hypothetical protein